FQCQGCTGTETSDAPFTSAHRVHLVSTVEGGSSILGNPPGRSSHPWSVTIRTFCHPSSSSSQTNCAKVSISFINCPASSAPCSCPNLSIFPDSVQPPTEPEGAPASLSSNT